MNDKDLRELADDLRGLGLSASAEVIRRMADELVRLTADRAGDQQRLFHYEGEMERLRKENKELRAALELANQPVWDVR